MILMATHKFSNLNVRDGSIVASIRKNMHNSMWWAVETIDAQPDEYFTDFDKFKQMNVIHGFCVTNSI